MPEYYDGTKLLSMTDINGQIPEIYICTTNRTGGKTTYFSRLCVNRYLRGNGQFMLLYRWSYEVDNVGQKFFNDIGNLFFKDYTMTSKSKSKGMYTELYLAKKDNPDAKEVCGFAVCLTKADTLKRFSHLFSNVNCMMFDEFQSESNHYAPNEIDKLISIHTSVARGNGEQVRYVPIFMLSNAVSIINPYYITFGITQRLTSKTHFLRGDGFVLEQGYIDTAAQAQKTSGFNRAFKASSYVTYAAENIYLNDNNAFITNISGKSRYLATLRFNGTDFAIREYAEQGIIYVDKSPDSSFGLKLTVTTEDHNINYLMLNRSSMFLAQLRTYFEHGCFRFKDLQCKEAILTALCY